MQGDAAVDASLSVDGVTFTARDAALLRAVDANGSLNAASDALDRSFAHAQRRVTDLETAFGPLLERTRGGVGGGGSRLTDNARTLLARFDRLAAAVTWTADVDETVLDGRVVDRDGELGVVETAAGTVRALVPPAATDVQVSIRADAVTLYAPDDSPGDDATSARNRFTGTVVDVDRGESVALVTVDIGATEPLLALVTTASIDRLDLAPGRPVVASLKATATRCV